MSMSHTKQKNTYFLNMIKQKGGGSLRAIFGPKNSKKFLQYLLTVRRQFHPKRTTLIPPIHPEYHLKE